MHRTVLILGSVGALTLASSLVGAGAERPTQPARSQDGAIASKPVLTLLAAQASLDSAVAFARSRAGTGAIAVVDDTGAVVAMQRLDGTFPAASEVAVGKARTAAIFRKPTRVFEDSINSGRIAMTSMHAYVFLQGGVPILVDGQVVGAVGVSGAASAKEDDEIASAGAGNASGGR